MGCGESKELTAQRIGEGLKAALDLAASETVKQLGAAGGFANSPLRLKTPGTLGSIFDTVRPLPGLGDAVSSFENKMNEAAEAACGAVLDIFRNFINGMSFADAKAILNGATNEATKYFRQVLEADILAKFTPVVHQKMNEMGVVEVYATICGAYERIPLLGSKVEFNIHEYVVGKAFDGFFETLAQWEAAVRNTPAMREHSQVLKEVFGSKQ